MLKNIFYMDLHEESLSYIDVFATYIQFGHSALNERISEESMIEVTINLDSFIINLFGCFDNLAHVWIYEKNKKKLRKHEIGFMKNHKKMRTTLSTALKEKLEQYGDWVDVLKKRRDSLAHRIPHYIPPYIIDSEKEREYYSLKEREIHLLIKNPMCDEYNETKRKVQLLEKQTPIIYGSLSERPVRPILFHAQVINDWKTVVEFSKVFLDELEK